MTDREKPKCPMGHEMELIQTASGSWRYGCLKCATSFKAIKRPTYGWLSPMKSTKERAYEAAIARPLQKPIAETDLGNYIDTPVWFEEMGRDVEYLPLLLDGIGIYYAEFKEFGEAERLDRRIDDYNYQWRCWAENPTDEERKAAPWE